MARRRLAARKWAGGVAKYSAAGALVLATIVVFRAVTRGAQIDAGELGRVVGWASLSGAVSGFVYGVFGVPLKRLGKPGPYLAGIVAAAAYAAMLITVIIPRLENEPRRGDGADWFAGILIAIVGGLAFGAEIAKDQNS